MNVHLIAEIAAGIAVLATVVYLGLGIWGVTTLRDIRDAIRDKRP
ncbi:MAG TPA: hypothetical protein VIJ65_09900 [Acidobacteriaceae bacterium]